MRSIWDHLLALFAMMGNSCVGWKFSGRLWEAQMYVGVQGKYSNNSLFALRLLLPDDGEDEAEIEA